MIRFFAAIMGLFGFAFTRHLLITILQALDAAIQETRFKRSLQ